MKRRPSLRRTLADRQAEVFNARMLRALMLTAAIGLAACAASPAADTGADPDLAFALGSDLNCNASELRQCPAGGCTASSPGETTTLPVSLSVPDRGGQGRFCIATGCEDALYAPTLTRALGWTATMRTRDRTEYAANLEIARNLQTFTLRRTGENGSIETWTGECSPAGS
jgi:hypothetical protein